MLTVMRKVTHKGFTLVELLIVIIIIAILAAVVVPKFGNSSTRGKEGALRSDLKVMRNAIDLYKADTGLLPLVLTDLAATTAPANGLNASAVSTAIVAADWKGPYLDSIDPDPFGTAYTYVVAAGPNLGKVSSATVGYTTW